MEKSYDVMTPVKNESGEDIWMRVGKAWTPGPGKSEVIISIMTMPINQKGPLRLFLYPEKNGSKTPTPKEKEDTFTERFLGDV